MRFLFYSTSSSKYDGTATETISLPPWASQWEKLANSFPTHEFIIATHLPGMFLLDLCGNEIAQKSSKIQYYIIKNDKEKEIAAELSVLKADIAIALSFYVMPYDWLSVKDSVVADFLRSNGIKTICHSVETSLICFDKWRCHLFLEKAGITCAKAEYLHHELYINAGNRRELKSNVYADAVFHQIKKLSFPAIIKDTVGLSSFGADVVNSYDEAVGILHSKKTTSDRIIEEMISGEQFGCEIYGTYSEEKNSGSYTILPPFMFSVNQYGITSPKQSVKIGPFLEENPSQNEKYKLTELKNQLLKLALALKLNGIAQIDLVFDGKKWFVIEINPRLSGMSTTYAASHGFSLAEMIFRTLFTSRFPLLSPSLNLKFPILEKQRLSELASVPYIVFVNQIENKAAKQIREQGYCEVILTGKTAAELQENLLDLKEKFSDVCEKEFFLKAKRMCEKLS